MSPFLSPSLWWNTPPPPPVRAVSYFPMWSDATLAFLCFRSHSILWPLCNVDLTGDTHGNRALRCHIWAGKREQKSKAEKVTRVASCSPDECQETHICLWSMGTGSWSSTCIENQFQTSSLNKEEPYEVLQRQISGWVSQSRTYCQPPTYGSHMHTQSIKGSSPVLHITIIATKYSNNYSQKSNRNDLNTVIYCVKNPPGAKNTQRLNQTLFLGTKSP